MGKSSNPTNRDEENAQIFISNVFTVLTAFLVPFFIYGTGKEHDINKR